MAQAQVGWHADGRYINTFPSVLVPALGRLREGSTNNYELRAFVTNQDTKTWELSMDAAGVTYRLLSDPLDTRHPMTNINLAAGETIVLYADATVTTSPSAVFGVISINAEVNACDISRESAKQRLIVLDVIANRILRDLNSGPVSEETRISLRSSSQFLRGLARHLREDFGIVDDGS